MTYGWAQYELDEERFELRREGAPVPVQRKVFELLHYFVRARDRVVHRQELLDAVWPGVSVGDASLARAVVEARRAIGDEDHEVLVTVRGVGFRFVAPVVEKSRRSAPPPRGSPGLSSIVGRTAALHDLEVQLAEARAGRGGVVWISGEAGIGKTRVAEELVARARSGHATTVVSATAHESPAAPPYWLAASLARGIAAERGRKGEPRSLGEVEALLKRASDHDSPFALFAALTRFLFEAASTSPLLLVVDDAQWFDEASTRYLEFLSREIRQSRILLVGTYRDALDDRDPRSRSFGALLADCPGVGFPLRGLVLEEIVSFVHMIKGTLPSEAFARALADRTGGNPRYMLWVLQTEWATRGLTQNGRGIASSIDVQKGLSESIRRHLEALSSPARDLLTLAAVLGKTFDLAELLLVSGLPSAELMSLLDEGERCKILTRAKAGGYRFTHALVHDVLYKALSTRERALKHAAAAEKLAKHYGDTSDTHLAALARHFVRALPEGSAEKALELSIKAAQQAAARDESHAALKHWDAAALASSYLPAADARLGPIRLGAARARARTGDREGARDAFLDAAFLARARGDADAFAEASLGFAMHENKDAPLRRTLLLEAQEMLLASASDPPLPWTHRIREALAE
jgi:DNA-binding winged helix-turn-helix (wHTH) protein